MQWSTGIAIFGCSMAVTYLALAVMRRRRGQDDE